MKYLRISWELLVTNMVITYPTWKIIIPKLSIRSENVDIEMQVLWYSTRREWTLGSETVRMRFYRSKKGVVVVLRSPIHANEPSEYNGMLYRTSNRVLNNGIKVIILICMDGTSQYHHHQKRGGAAHWTVSQKFINYHYRHQKSKLKIKFHLYLSDSYHQNIKTRVTWGLKSQKKKKICSFHV